MFQARPSEKLISTYRTEIPGEYFLKI